MGFERADDVVVELRGRVADRWKGACRNGGLGYRPGRLASRRSLELGSTGRVACRSRTCTAAATMSKAHAATIQVAGSGTVCGGLNGRFTMPKSSKPYPSDRLLSNHWT